jgi:hypothetical protein
MALPPVSNAVVLVPNAQTNFRSNANIAIAVTRFLSLSDLRGVIAYIGKDYSKVWAQKLIRAVFLRRQGLCQFFHQLNSELLERISAVVNSRDNLNRYLKEHHPKHPQIEVGGEASVAALRCDPKAYESDNVNKAILKQLAVDRLELCSRFKVIIEFAKTFFLALRQARVGVQDVAEVDTFLVCRSISPIGCIGKALMAQQAVLSEIFSEIKVQLYLFSVLDPHVPLQAFSLSLHAGLPTFVATATGCNFTRINFRFKICYSKRIAKYDLCNSKRSKDNR